jgi:hypothetical protein
MKIKKENAENLLIKKVCIPVAEKGGKKSRRDKIK